MKKNTFAIVICFILILSLTSCSKASEIELDIGDVYIGGESGAVLGEDDNSTPYIENLADGGYIEWSIVTDNKSEFSIEVEYATLTETDSILNAEIYAENGKLAAQTVLELTGTASPAEFSTVTGEINELEAGRYTLILRPDNLESKAVNIKSVKLLP